MRLTLRYALRSTSGRATPPRRWKHHRLHPHEPDARCYAEASSNEPTAVELVEADAVSVVELEEADEDAELVCEP